MKKNSLRLALRFAMMSPLFVLVSGVQAQTNPCEHEHAKWTPSRYFDRGDLVYYKGAWFEARHWHSGTEPQDSGNFAWEKQEGVPPCEALLQDTPAPSQKTAVVQPSEPASERALEAESRAPDTEPKAPGPGTSAEQMEAAPTEPRQTSSVVERIRRLVTTEPSRAEVQCDRIEPWSFAGAYGIGEHVRYEGRYYRAIRASNGHMPGALTPPPHWEPVELGCPSQ